MSATPSEEASNLAVEYANLVYFDCDTLHTGPLSLGALYDRLALSIDALVARRVEEERRAGEAAMLELVKLRVSQERERCARLVETQYRRESDALHAEDATWDAQGVRRRTRERDAAAIRSTPTKG